MNSHIVHVEYPNIIGYAYPHVDGGRAMNFSVPGGYIRHENFNVHENTSYEDHAKIIRTFGARNQPEAELLARLLASYAPGSKVLVCEVKVVAQANIGTPVLSSVTEKGIVPR